MPIATRELKQNFIVVDESSTVQQVRDWIAETGDKWTYIIVRLADGRFAVLRLDELIRVLQSHSDILIPEMLLARLVDVPDLLAPRAGEAVEQASMGTGRARQLLYKMPGNRLVVLSGGEVLGLLAMEPRLAATGVDLEWLDRPLPYEVHTAMKPEPVPKSPASLSADDELEESPPSQAGPPERFINAEIEDHDRDEPLQVGEVYTLAFGVDLERSDEAIVSTRLDDSALFAAGEQQVELTIQLASDDFQIEPPSRKLRVPRTGRSKGKARFDIEPRHEGEGVINAVFLKDGNFIQLITLKLQVGGPSQAGVLNANAAGRPVEAAFVAQPRDVSLTILKADDGFQLIMSGVVGAMGRLPITDVQLDQMINQVRQELQGIVHLEVNSKKIYQAGIDIPPQVNQIALARLARAGFRLYQRIFYGPAADAQANLIGDTLRKMAQKETLKIQIFSQHFTLPWGILYMADEFDPDHVDPELFLGLKHIIEHIPLQQTMRVIEGTIPSRPQLTVSLNLNADIDQQMGAPLIASQEADWGRISQSAGVKLLVRKTKDEVTRALADASTPDHILYFYCHAASRSLAEGGGPDASTLVLSNNGRLALGDLYIDAPLKIALPGAPLVFINACESAELSPTFYDGFVPYFMAKGARGVIGTECETPALFAAEWARRFFLHFLTGKSLGQAFLDLRREFYYQHNNLMGLLYALYCDGDTQVVPELQIS
ncbi:MAG: hypothetical protein Kow0063_35010 [Anaerolineae bacterium]